MLRFMPVLVLLLAAVPTMAAGRVVGIGSFDRIRITGPFEVRLTTGRSPAASIAGDRRRADAVDLRVEGTTLILRTGSSVWGEQPRGTADTPLVVTLASPGLVSALVTGGGRLTIARMKAPRIDLMVTGSGAIALTGAEADDLNATLVGTGTLAIAGRAARVRLLTDGPGTIDASALEAGALTVRLDGVGTTRARARYTADIVNVGLGTVSVEGSPKCTVKAAAGGPVQCGVKAPGG